LFLVSGLVENATGTGALRRLGGLLHRAPLIAVLFVIPALSLAGLPPFSGFVAKLALVQAGMDADRYVVVGASLVVSLLTLFSMTKIWAGVFWGTPEDEPPLVSARGSGHLAAPRLMVAPTAVLVAISLAVAIGAAPLYDLSHQAAEALVDRTPYIQEVLGP
jgi:multicomponent Na+:H+ antiporter subunit D